MGSGAYGEKNSFSSSRMQGLNSSTYMKKHNFLKKAWRNVLLSSALPIFLFMILGTGHLHATPELGGPALAIPAAAQSMEPSSLPSAGLSDPSAVAALSSSASIGVISPPSSLSELSPGGNLPSPASAPFPSEALASISPNIPASIPEALSAPSLPASELPSLASSPVMEASAAQAPLPSLPLTNMEHLAQPDSYKIIGGQGTVRLQDPHTLVFTQTTRGNIIVQWPKGLNLGPQDHLIFNQPTSSSIVLNDINQAYGRSVIRGHIESNGNVWFMNPAGIHFTKTAKAEVGGILAFTHTLTHEDFLAKRYVFSENTRGGTVLNEGQIHLLRGGLAGLIGNSVFQSSQGAILAKLGEAYIGGKRAIILDFDGDRLISLRVSKESPVVPLGNGQNVDQNPSAPGIQEKGAVLLTAKDAHNVLENSVNMEGFPEGAYAEDHNGVILVRGHSEISGTIQGKVIHVENESLDLHDATISNEGQKGSITVGETAHLTRLKNVVLDGSVQKGKGNTVKVLGKKVQDDGNLRVKADGPLGGGNIFYGGGKRGKDISIPNSDDVSSQRTSHLSASATHKGPGGTIVAWSNANTRFHGRMAAKGGPKGGNGGFLEVSSEGKWSIEDARFDTRAPMGTQGKILFDPKTITVTTEGGGSYADVSSYAAGGVASDIAISPDTLSIASAGGDVILEATDTVTFLPGITLNLENGFTAKAGRNLVFGDLVSIITNGPISLTANASDAPASSERRGGTGPGGIATGDLTLDTTEAFPITFAVDSGSTGRPAGNITLGSISTSNENQFTASTPENLFLGGNITLNGTGNMSLTAQSGIELTGDVVIQTNGDITFENDLAGSNYNLTLSQSSNAFTMLLQTISGVFEFSTIGNGITHLNGNISSGVQNWGTFILANKDVLVETTGGSLNFGGFYVLGSPYAVSLSTITELLGLGGLGDGLAPLGSLSIIAPNSTVPVGTTDVPIYIYIGAPGSTDITVSLLTKQGGAFAGPLNGLETKFATDSYATLREGAEGVFTINGFPVGYVSSSASSSALPPSAQDESATSLTHIVSDGTPLIYIEDATKSASDIKSQNQGLITVLP